MTIYSFIVAEENFMRINMIDYFWWESYRFTCEGCFPNKWKHGVFAVFLLKWKSSLGRSLVVKSVYVMDMMLLCDRFPGGNLTRFPCRDTLRPQSTCTPPVRNTALSIRRHQWTCGSLNLIRFFSLRLYQN